MKLIWIITAYLGIAGISALAFQAGNPATEPVPEEKPAQESERVEAALVKSAATPMQKETSTMNEEKAKKINDAHQYFAVELNNEVWRLLQKPDRSPTDNERMIYTAHASCYHWLHVGTGVNHQRGEWLIAHVFTELRMADDALRHAVRCLALTEEHKGLMQDFDHAYAFECVARANALAGNHDEAVKYRQLAEKFGNLIADEEDKKIFMSDFTGGNWFGLK